MVDKKNNIKNDEPTYSIVMKASYQAMSPAEETDRLIPHPLHKTSIAFPQRLDGETAQRLFDALEELGVSVYLHNRDATDGDDWEVSLTTMGPPDVKALRARILEAENIDLPESAFSVERLPETDWLRHVHENFPPVTIGRFFVYGSHVTEKAPAGLIPLQIDAATAFGSGEHETTKGCMLAFDWLLAQGFLPAQMPLHALDMGCGSGILGIAITKIWPEAKVTAIDIDPESVVVTNRHAQLNGASAVLDAAAGDGYNTALCQSRAPYDLVGANILAGPLIDMAPQLQQALKPGGFAVLSGLLGRQEAEVTAAHKTQGLELRHAIALGDWRALVLQKPL